MDKERSRNVQAVAQIIYNKKGANIVGLDVREISSMTDHVLIAEGMIDRHVIAMGKAVQEEMKHSGTPPARVEGYESGDWVVLDFVDFIVHIFTPQTRELFQLEKLFAAAKTLDLDLSEV